MLCQWFSFLSSNQEQTTTNFFLHKPRIENLLGSWQQDNNLWQLFVHKQSIENLLDYHMLVQLSLCFVEFLGIWLLLLLGMAIVLFCYSFLRRRPRWCEFKTRCFLLYSTNNFQLHPFVLFPSWVVLMFIVNFSSS